MKQETLDALRTIYGAERLLTSPEDLLTYSYDGTPLMKQRPGAVALARSTDEIAATLRLANEARFPVVTRGSGTGLSGGSIPLEDSLALVITGMNRILEVDTANLTARVEPGVITADLHRAVESRGLFYPPDPGSQDICTLGGNVAENSGGLRGLKYGVTRNYVMGLEIVLPTGEVTRFGNACVKDVAGYSMKDLFIGSEGTLGVFTEILVRLIPLPRARKTMLAVYADLGAAAESVSAIIAAGITPCTLEFLDNITIGCVEDYARVGLPTDADAILLVEVDGHPAVVDEEADAVRRICAEHGATRVDVARDADHALKLAEARRTAFAALARVKPTTILEDATVPRSRVADMVRRIQETSRKYNVMIGTFGHAGDGNLHPTCLTDERDTEELERVEKAFEEIFHAAIEMGGTITGEHGVGIAKRGFLRDQLGDPALEVMRKLRRELDPNGILSPGKVVEMRPRCEDPLPRQSATAATQPA